MRRDGFSCKHKAISNIKGDGGVKDEHPGFPKAVYKIV